MSVKIIVDSTCNAEESVMSKLQVVPLTVHFGEEEYLDGVDIDNSRFYEMLIESDTLPTTSQASPGIFEQTYQKALADGSNAVVITVAGKLSGTYQSACIAAENYEGRVYVVDSGTVAIGTGILAKCALEMAQKGCSAPQIAKEIGELADRVNLIALLDTLEYLKKGGRISKTVAMAGSLLSIKPVVSVKNGEIQMLGKARGSKQGNNLLCTSVQKTGVDFTRPVMLGYTGLDDSLLKKYIQDSAALWEGNCTSLPYALIGSVIGTHVGPGAIAVAYIEQN